MSYGSSMRDRPLPANAPMAFLSDIHGNYTALEAVLDDLQRRLITQIYVGGDLLLGGTGSGAFEVFKRLQQVGARCVRGLSDNALIEVSPDRLSPSDPRERLMAERFAETRRSLGEVTLKYLERLPEKLRIPLVDGSEILLVHGSPLDPTLEITHDLSDAQIEHLLAGDPADIVVCGASHVPFQRDLEDQRVVNIGSVGQAPEGDVAHYTVITPRMDGILIEQSWADLK